MKSEELTFGEKAVGLEFNPSGDSDVWKVKRHIADLIDELHIKRSESDNQEIKRMLSIAITDLQTAQMWAVKALTWKY